MWDPRCLTTLLASTACYRDSFTFLLWNYLQHNLALIFGKFQTVEFLALLFGSYCAVINFVNSLSIYISLVIMLSIWCRTLPRLFLYLRKVMKQSVAWVNNSWSISLPLNYSQANITALLNSSLFGPTSCMLYGDVATPVGRKLPTPPAGHTLRDVRKLICTGPGNCNLVCYTNRFTVWKAEGRGGHNHLTTVYMVSCQGVTYRNVLVFVFTSKLTDNNLWYQHPVVL
jgi:hypothetical protein